MRTSRFPTLHLCVTCLSALLLDDLPAQTLAQALDGPGWTWTTRAETTSAVPLPGAEWVGQTTLTQDGVDAAASGPLPPFGIGYLSGSGVTGPGTVVFWRRHNMDDGQNPFGMLVNGAALGLYLPGGSWQPVAVDVPDGPVTLDFSWWAMPTATVPEPRAAVDGVSFVPLTGPPVMIPDAPPALSVGEGRTIVLPIALTGQKPMTLQLTVPGMASPYEATIDAPASGGTPRLSAFPFAFNAEPARSGVWSLTATNAVGTVTRTVSVTVTPSAPHGIFIDAPSTAWAGADFILTASAGGTAPFTWQWHRNGSPLAGQTAETLEITGFSAAQEGDYHVVVTNALGSRASAVTTIDLGSVAPGIEAQPGDMTVPLFGYQWIDAEISGTPPLTAVWRRNGEVIDTRSGLFYRWTGLSVPGDSLTDPGVYRLTVQNGLGTATGQPIVVQVGRGAQLAAAMDFTRAGWRHDEWAAQRWEVVTTGTHDGVDALRQAGADTSPLSVAVQGPAAAAFWWRVADGDMALRLDGVEVRRVSAAPFTSGSWERVEVSIGPGWHELTWDPEMIGHGRSVFWLDEFAVTGGAGGPVVTQHPAGGSYLDGDVATLSASVSGAGPFTFRLMRGTAVIEEEPGVVGGTHAFSIDVTPASAGPWRIEVADGAGRSVITDDAVLTVDGNTGSLSGVAAALGQPQRFCEAATDSWVDGLPHDPVPWVVSRSAEADGPAVLSARTPVLAAGGFSGLRMTLDFGQAGPRRLRYAVRASGAALGDVLAVEVDGVEATPTVTGSFTGTDGQSWSRQQVMLSGSFHEIQWEALAPVAGVTLHLDSVVIDDADPPTITSEPQPLVRPAGESGSLSVTVQSGVPVSYQWYRAGVGPVAGATGPELTFASLSPGDSGTYHVEAVNEFGTAESDPATVTVTGPRPVFSQPPPPRWVRPGDPVTVPAAVSGGTGGLTWRWLKNGVVVQNGGTAYQLPAAGLDDDGVLRVEVSDNHYTITHDFRLVVSPVLYQVTWLPAAEAGGTSWASAVNGSGLVAGTGGSAAAGYSALLWEAGVPRRLSPPGSPPTSAAAVDDDGVVTGLRQSSGGVLNASALMRWRPPYGASDVEVIPPPQGHPYLEVALANRRGDLVVTDYDARGQMVHRRPFRRTAAGEWERLGTLTGAWLPPGAIDNGEGTALWMNAAGEVAGQTVLRAGGPGFLAATGWVSRPWLAARVAMDAAGPEVAGSSARPWGWWDVVNDRGDLIGRRWAPAGPTVVYAQRAGAAVETVLTRPGAQGISGSCNVDAVNNRREMAGFIVTESGQRAAIFRRRTAAAGEVPTDFTGYTVRDLNELVVGGTGVRTLFTVTGMNDAGQLAGTALEPGPQGEAPTIGFLLTPTVPYPAMAALAVDDVIEPGAGGSVEFTAASLLGNDAGAPPLTLTAVNVGPAPAGSVVPAGSGRWLYTAPGGSAVPDGFRYRIADGAGRTAEAWVRVVPARPPLPPSNGHPMQMYPDGRVAVRFSGFTPGSAVVLLADDDLSGDGTLVATLEVAPDGTVSYVDLPPPGANRRFYRLQPP